MRVLALETSTRHGSVAACDGRDLLLEIDLDERQQTAQSLAPAMQAILKRINWQPRDVELLAVTGGPGSFTGLRAGVTAAKVFAYACGCQVIAVDALDVIALQSEATAGFIWSVVNAQRKQLFTAQFAAPIAVVPAPLQPTRIMDRSAWLESLSAGTTVIGTGLVDLTDQLPAGIVVSSEDRWRPRAATVASLGSQLFAAGRRQDLWTLVPQYFRKSYAEEKLKPN